MNILFIHEVDYLRKVVYEIHNWSELLSSLGHDIYFIDFENEWRRDCIFDLGTLRTKVFHDVSRINNSSCITVIRPGFIKVPLLDRISAFFTHCFEVESVVRKRRIDAIILYSVPTNGLQTVRIAKKYKIPVVFRSLDVLHTLVPKALRPATFSLERLVYANVDKILTESPKLSNYVIRMGADRRKVELLLLGVDMNKFSPNVDTRALKDKFRIIEDDKVIVFIGTLYDFSGLDLYLKQFPTVLKEIPEAKLIIVGGGTLFGTLKKLVADLKLTGHVILTDFQPYDMIPLYINLATICINPFLINPTTRDIMPGKIIQYLACAKPVLATPLPGMISLLSGPDKGILYSSIEDFADNTVKLLKDDHTSKAIGESGYRYIEKNHGELAIARRLERILNQMITKRR